MIWYLLVVGFYAMAFVCAGAIMRALGVGDLGILAGGLLIALSVSIAMMVYGEWLERK